MSAVIRSPATSSTTSPGTMRSAVTCCSLAVAQDRGVHRQQVAQARRCALSPVLLHEREHPVDQHDRDDGCAQGRHPAHECQCRSHPEQQREEVHELLGQAPPDRHLFGPRQHVRPHARQHLSRLGAGQSRGLGRGSRAARNPRCSRVAAAARVGGPTGQGVTGAFDASHSSRAAVTSSAASFCTKCPADSMGTTVASFGNASVPRRASGLTSSWPRKASWTPQMIRTGTEIGCRLRAERRSAPRSAPRKAPRYQLIGPRRVVLRGERLAVRGQGLAVPDLPDVRAPAQHPGHGAAHEPLGQHRELEEEHVPGLAQLSRAAQQVLGEHSWGWAVHRDQGGHPLGVQLGDGPGHSPAPVVADHDRVLSAHRVEHRDDVGGEVRRGVGPVTHGPGVPALVRGDDPVPSGGEFGDLMAPRDVELGESVEQDDDGAVLGALDDGLEVAACRSAGWSCADPVASTQASERRTSSSTSEIESRTTTSAASS